MGGDARSPEHQVRCLPSLTFQGGNEELPFEVDGKRRAVSLKIGGFTKQIVTGLDPKALDLLEIAALVYGVDAAVTRGGLTDPGLGKKWHRGFRVEMPVRCPSTWNNPLVKNSLEETLQFLSGDRFEFTFVSGASQPEESKWFDFGREEGWRADRVLMFSGGLDSFAGALEEVIEQRNKVALVSHYSSTKIRKVQRDLSKALSAREGSDRLRHLPMQIQLKKGTNREGTHRTRSFLFAALGLITAMAFGRDRVSFHENGVVSLNLPPVGNVVGTRATRTTHPQVLQRFSTLFSVVFDASLRVDNPFFWRTKTEVLETINRLGAAGLVDVTSSCADTHNRSRQYPHCGRCSQCIDRRFAVLAAGMEDHDSRDAYAVDLLEGERLKGQDRELAVSYVRMAHALETASPSDLLIRFPTLVSCVEHLGLGSSLAMERLGDLLRRHGRSVGRVMRTVLDSRPPHEYPANSLPRLYGEWQKDQALGTPTIPAVSIPEDSNVPLALVIDRKRAAVTIDGTITFARTTKTAELLIYLADMYLKDLGEGRMPFDFRSVSASELASALNLEGEDSARNRVLRARAEIRRKFRSADREQDLGKGLIESGPWKGYRLAPERVKVTVHNED